MVLLYALAPGPVHLVLSRADLVQHPSLMPGEGDFAGDSIVVEEKTSTI
jgi:hypothetical protein